MSSEAASPKFTPSFHAILSASRPGQTPTSARERIRVRFAALDGEPDAVWLDKEASPGG